MTEHQWVSERAVSTEPHKPEPEFSRHVDLTNHHGYVVRNVSGTDAQGTKAKFPDGHVIECGTIPNGQIIEPLAPIHDLNIVAALLITWHDDGNRVQSATVTVK